MSLAEDGRSVLETGKAERSVWLMKCPPVVARCWQSSAAAAAGAASSDAASNSTAPVKPVVSKVVLSLDLARALAEDEAKAKAKVKGETKAEESNSLQFTMEMAQNEAGIAPKCYSLNMFQDFVPMCIFSESNQGKFSLEGKVEHKFDMEPHRENFREYGKLCRERTNKAMIKTRQVQVIDNDHGGLMRPLPGMVGLVASGSKDKKKVTPTKGSEAKRTRRDRRELENIIFKLFERQPNWALKQLVQETDQPEQFLKEILNDLCVYNKRGPNQGTHELKPEYKKSTEEIETA